MIYGNGDGTFNPGGAVIREHACAFIYRYCNNRSVPLTPYERDMVTFTDQSSITSNMLPGITALYRANMISGDGNGYCRPQSNITKAEAATLLANLDCREYNNDSTICVYVKDESGKACVSSAVYIVPSSSSSIAYTPVLSKGTAPQKGIARYEGLDKNQTYGVNVHTKSTMVTIQDLKKPARKYVFAVIPSSKSKATNIPISGYTRGHWGHVDGQCTEGRWAYNDDFCPTTQRRLNQNFGWRYGMNGREFHQGLDFSCTLAAVKSIAGAEATVTKVYRKIDPSYGRYVQMRVGTTYFTYQHLDSIESWVEEGVTVAKDQTFAVSGNTGIGTGYHLHVTVATIDTLAPNTTAASDTKRNKYMDPRIYID
ncbi:MAG: peptidoglycan DD-metalloendopeptidase family protein [Clostridiales bacterium]|nr:peptidoglycan DD-metalloendopeptidase family protein [Clostridiales bacterium]